MVSSKGLALLFSDTAKSAGSGSAGLRCAAMRAVV
jgi:hypothetical protein